MNKKTKMWLGVAVLGVAGYFLYQKYGKKPITPAAASTTPPVLANTPQGDQQL